MEINTKYEIGELLYILHNNRIKKVSVEDITIFVKDKVVQYDVNYLDIGTVERFTINEDDIFKTKEELINNLLKFVQ